MATTLLDSVKKQLGDPAAEQKQAQPQLGKTEQVQGLLRAKMGKAGAGGGTTPRISSLQEQQAARQTQLGRQQLQQRGKLQAEGITQKEEQQRVQEEEAEANLMERREDLRSNFERQTENVLQDLKRGQREMDSREYQSKLEQAGFLARLQNDQYIHQLQQEGQKARLDDMRQFEIEMARDAYQDREDLMQDDAAFRAMMDSSDREFEEALQNMTFEMALEEAEKETAAAKRKGYIDLASTIFSAGTSGVQYSTSQRNQNQAQQPTSGGDGNSSQQTAPSSGKPTAI